MNTQDQSEQIGHKYSRTRYEVHSRRIGSEGWYGTTRYASQVEAQKAIDSLGGRYMNLGNGLTLDTGEATDIYEYRIVKVEAACEVVHVELKKI